MPEENILIMENGQVLEINSNETCITGNVPAGKILVDGLGVGDVGNIVLRDRKHLSEDGIIIIVVTIQKETGNIITGPDVISRGFVFVRESEEFLQEVRVRAKDALINCNCRRLSAKKNAIKYGLMDYVFQKTQSRPMLLPIIMEI